MLSVKGIYDGERLRLIEEVKISKPVKVIVTFLEENDDNLNEEIYSIAQQGSAFDFLKEPKEDIYSDNDLKVRYKK